MGLAFCVPIKTFRLVSLIFDQHLLIESSLNYCLDFGVHYSLLCGSILLVATRIEKKY